MRSQKSENIFVILVALVLCGGQASAGPVQLNCLDPYFNAIRDLEPKVQPAKDLIKKSDELESKKRSTVSRIITVGAIAAGIAVGVATSPSSSVDRTGEVPVVRQKSTGYRLLTGTWTGGISATLFAAFGGGLASLYGSSRFDVTLDGELEAKATLVRYNNLSWAFRLLQAIERVANPELLNPSAYNRELDVIKVAITYSRCGGLYTIEGAVLGSAWVNDYDCTKGYDMNEKVGEFVTNVTQADLSRRSLGFGRTVHS
jgi:hypothetical protein